ncbi:MAG TPA: hypothetical protein VH880_01960 [Anaeromyxobacteraceae bacterium]|jgi:hypothetical protein
MRTGSWLRGFLALAAIALAGSAGAAPRIAVGPLRGDRKGALASQLSTSLCRTYECVPRSRVVTGGRPDAVKARRLRVAILAGTVAQEAMGRQLTLALITRSARPQKTWKFWLTARGTLPASALSQLEDDLGAELGVAPAPLPPAPRRPPPPAAPPRAVPPPPALPPAPPPAAAAPPPAAAPAPSPPAPAPAAEAAVPPRRPPPPPAAPRAAAPAREGRWLLAVELGLDFRQRKLSFQGVPTGNALLGLEASAIASPRLRVELFPLSGAASDLLAGFGVVGDYRLAVGLKTKTQGPPVEKRSTSASQLQAGIQWRIRPTASGRAAIVPGVSWVQQRYAVKPSIAGLPDAELAGVRGSIGAEIPVGGSAAILAEGGYAKWLTAKDLVKGQPAFFPGKSAWGLDAQVGASVALSGRISLRLLLEYGLTRYSLSADPSGTYAATGGSDRYLGGRAMLRGQL